MEAKMFFKPVRAVAATAVQDTALQEKAVRIALKFIRPAEGLSLRAYPDPASPLSKELAKHGILQKFIDGKLELPPHLRKLSGAPWTVGYGNTENVKEGDVWTLERAESDLFAKGMAIAMFVLQVAPKLSNQAPEKLAACISLAYNIGNDAFAKSTVCKMIGKEDWEAAADAFLMWNKAQGKVMQGLVNRRNKERDLFRSVTLC